MMAAPKRERSYPKGSDSVIPSPYEDGLDMGREFVRMGHTLRGYPIGDAARIYSHREWDQRQWKRGFIDAFAEAAA
jgi:hypothetical protein